LSFKLLFLNTFIMRLPKISILKFKSSLTHFDDTLDNFRPFSSRCLSVIESAEKPLGQVGDAQFSILEHLHVVHDAVVRRTRIGLIDIELHAFFNYFSQRQVWMNAAVATIGEGLEFFFTIFIKFLQNCEADEENRDDDCRNERLHGWLLVE
jgi:hypothetical protein